MNERLASALRELAAALEELEAEPAPRQDEPEQLYSVDEAARILGVGRSSVYAEIGAGRLRSLTVGRRRLIPASALAEYTRAGAAIETPAPARGGRRASGEPRPEA